MYIDYASCDIFGDRLRERLNPNGKLYIVGMEPIPDTAVAPTDVVCEVKYQI